jgi:site-specific recombinase XerD
VGAFERSDAFASWLCCFGSGRAYSAHSIRAYVTVARQFWAWLAMRGIRELRKVTPDDLASFIESRPDGRRYGRASMNTRVAAMRLYYEHALSAGLAQDDLMVGFRLPRPKRVPSRPVRASAKAGLPVLSWEEQDRLMDAAMASEGLAGFRDAAAIGTLLDTGLRTEELCALPVSAAEDYFAGSLHVVGRRNEERVARFTPDYADRLESYLVARRRVVLRKGGDNDLLFITNRCGPLTQQKLYQQIARHMASARIQKPQRGAHVLRHTAAAILLASGRDIHEVQASLGHQSVATTARYEGLLPARPHAARDDLARLDLPLL